VDIGVIPGGAVVALWLLFGIADWACHRASNIEGTSGTAENLLHWLQTALVGAQIIGLLLLAPTRGLLAGIVICAVLHSLVAGADILYTLPRRTISVVEHVVHGFLFLFPLLAAVPLLRGDALDPSWGLHAKTVLPSLPIIFAVVAAGVIGGIWPMANEYRRCRQASRRSRM
jgi:hypothetical protein